MPDETEKKKPTFWMAVGALAVVAAVVASWPNGSETDPPAVEPVSSLPQPAPPPIAEKAGWQVEEEAEKVWGAYVTQVIRLSARCESAWEEAARNGLARDQETDQAGQALISACDPVQERTLALDEPALGNEASKQALHMWAFQKSRTAAESGNLGRLYRRYAAYPEYGDAAQRDDQIVTDKHAEIRVSQETASRFLFEAVQAVEPGFK